MDSVDTRVLFTHTIPQFDSPHGNSAYDFAHTLAGTQIDRLTKEGHPRLGGRFFSEQRDCYLADRAKRPWNIYLSPE
jgi:hypothetical protein